MTGPAAATHLIGLSAGAERRERGMARWRARSWLIHRLRIALPAAIGVILLSMFGWVSFGALLSGLGAPRGKAALIHMTNAQFYGRDAQGRPYVISAAEATRSDTDLKLISLMLPTLTLTQGDGRLTHLSADRGAYREDNRVLRLQGHVTLRDSSGRVFHTDSAVADTIRSMVMGSSPVFGAGPTGDIAAGGFALDAKAGRLLFRGEVHSRMKRD